MQKSDLLEALSPRALPSGPLSKEGPAACPRRWSTRPLRTPVNVRGNASKIKALAPSTPAPRAGGNSVVITKPLRNRKGKSSKYGKGERVSPGGSELSSDRLWLFGSSEARA